MAIPILIADDLESLRKLVRSVLRELRLDQVDEAEDGQAALSMLEKTRYSLLIADWNMPRMDGLALLKAVREHETLNTMPVIMLTGDSTRNHVVEAAKLGISGFVVKPFTPEALAAAVRRVIPASG